MYVVCGDTTSVVYSVEAVWYSGSRLFCLNLFCELTKWNRLLTLESI